MKSIKDLYKIGKGPSSSHTIGPQRVCEYILKKYGEQKYRVDLFGSLSLTGKGHGTDRVIRETLGKTTEINFVYEGVFSHPNTFDVYYEKDGEYTRLLRAESIGGGDVTINGEPSDLTEKCYPHGNFAEIKEYCQKNGIRLSEYAGRFEKDIDVYIDKIWSIMKDSVERGLNAEGILPGGLRLARKARSLYYADARSEPSFMKESRKLSAYSLAVAEENADNGTIVTAPTCGSAGVVAACMYFMYKDYNVSEKKISDALLTAGIIGNIVKNNASVSGAECGCQAEIGVACSMAAAAVAEIYDYDVDKIECAAEIALEHNLGLTCDPVLGLVQIPCIERNAMAAVKAVNAVMLANSLSDKRKITFDEIVKVMYETGKSIAVDYRETSKGGLAKYYR